MSSLAAALAMRFDGGLTESTTEPQLRRAVLDAGPLDGSAPLVAYNAAVQTRLASEAQQRSQRFTIRDNRERSEYLRLAQVSGDMELTLSAATLATDLSVQSASSNALTNQVLASLVTRLDVAHNAALGPQLTAGASLGVAL